VGWHPDREDKAAWSTAGGVVMTAAAGGAIAWLAIAEPSTSHEPLWPVYAFAAVAVVGFYGMLAPLLQWWPHGHDEAARATVAEIDAQIPSSAPTSPSALFEELDDLTLRLTSYLRLRANKARGISAKWQKLKVKGDPDPYAYGYAIVGSSRYERQTARHYLTDFRSPLAVAIRRAMRMGVISKAEGEAALQSVWCPTVRVDEIHKAITAVSLIRDNIDVTEPEHGAPGRVGYRGRPGSTARFRGTRFGESLDTDIDNQGDIDVEDSDVD
jgi:hypothetical protein